MITIGVGVSSMIWLVASKPLMPGRLMSIVTRSGRSSAVMRTASSPLVA